MRRGLLVGLVAVIATAGGAVAAPGTPAPDGAPFVDAGLDQEVYVGDEVFLDGGGTWDDQGDITAKEWTIEAPDGRTIQPECPTCWFTSFVANQTGQYDATLTVHDAAGHVNSDTLYVTVQALEEDMLPEVANGSNGGSGGGNWGGVGDEGCWVSHSAAADWGESNPLVTDICDQHGRFLGYVDTNMGEVSEGNHRSFLEFEPNFLEQLYSEVYRTDRGTLLVPSNVVHNEVTGLEEAVMYRHEAQIWGEIHQYGGSAGIDRPENPTNNGGDGNGGTAETTEGGSTGGGGGGCVAPCGAIIQQQSP